MLENMKAWLQTFPQWEGSIQVDYLDAVPGNTGLYPKGITELSRREDVLGNVKVRCRSTFLLRKKGSAMLIALWYSLKSLPSLLSSRIWKRKRPSRS